jgi:hypothetical protein
MRTVGPLARWADVNSRGVVGVRHVLGLRCAAAQAGGTDGPLARLLGVISTPVGTRWSARFRGPPPVHLRGFPFPGPPEDNGAIRDLLMSLKVGMRAGLSGCLSWP